MDLQSGELQDWEVLRNSDDSGLVMSPQSVENMRELEGIEGASERIIRADYFSIDSQNRYSKSFPEAGVVEEGSVASDNASWIDPMSDTRYQREESTKFWSDSMSDLSDPTFGPFEVKNDLDFVWNVKTQVDYEEFGQIACKNENSGKFWSDSGGIGAVSMDFEVYAYKREVGFLDNTNFGDMPDLSSEENEVEAPTGGADQSDLNENEAIEAMKSGGDGGKKSVVWWKVPFEVLKYCVFGVRPICTFSVAAAVMGFIVLGRRLHQMKRKSRSLPLKVTLDDKKVSQFMSHAARLNEAFSVVKRVPVIRPSLSAAGTAPWPLITLR